MKRATRFASYELRTDGITLLLPLDGLVRYKTILVEQTREIRDISSRLEMIAVFPVRVRKKIWFIIELDQARTLSVRHHKDIYSEDACGSLLSIVSSILPHLASRQILHRDRILLLSVALDYPG